MLKISIQGLEKLRRLADEIKQSFEAEVNLSGIEPEIAAIITAQNARQLETETGPDGKRWQRLNASYERRKRRIVGAKPILQFTGSLQASLLSPGVTVSPDKRTLTVTYRGLNSELINIHAAGAPTRGLPSRPVGGLSEEARRKIIEIAFSKVTRGFAARLKERRIR